MYKEKKETYGDLEKFKVFCQGFSFFQLVFRNLEFFPIIFGNLAIISQNSQKIKQILIKIYK